MKNGSTPLDVCAILDWVLDEDFTDLEIDIPYQTIKSLSSLMSVIAHRSPKLKSLQITFYTISGISPPLEPPPRKVDPLEPNSISTSLLKYLTSLSLHHRDTGVDGFPVCSAEEPYEPILGIVAKSCPVLINLSVRGLRPINSHRSTTLYGATLSSFSAYGGFLKSSLLRSAQPFRRLN